MKAVIENGTQKRWHRREKKEMHPARDNGRYDYMMTMGKCACDRTKRGGRAGWKPSRTSCRTRYPLTRQNPKTANTVFETCTHYRDTESVRIGTSLRIHTVSWRSTGYKKHTLSTKTSIHIYSSSQCTVLIS